MIMNGSYFPSGRKGIICTTVGAIAAGKDPLATSICLSVHNLDLAKISLRLSVLARPWVDAGVCH